MSSVATIFRWELAAMSGTWLEPPSHTRKQVWFLSASSSTTFIERTNRGNFLMRILEFCQAVNLKQREEWNRVGEKSSFSSNASVPSPSKGVDRVLFRKVETYSVCVGGGNLQRDALGLEIHAQGRIQAISIETDSKQPSGVLLIFIAGQC